MTKSVLAFALIAAAFLVTGLVGGESRAQQAAPSSLDAIPDKMPFDVPYGAPISLERAQAVIAAAIAEAAKHEWKLNFAVVDSGGNLVAFARMDGAQFASVAISEHKARAAASFRRETKIFENGIQGGNVFQVTLDGVIASRGGIPLVENGKVIGAIGRARLPPGRRKFVPFGLTSPQ